MGEEGMRRRIFTVTAAMFLALLCYGFVQVLMSPLRKSKVEELERKRETFQETQLLLSQRKSYESEWEKAKALLPKTQTPEEALNLWVKELLSFAPSEGITFTKLEPQGTKEKEAGRKELRLSLLFQGDIPKLIHFLYFLLEKDPLSRIETFSLKQEEETKAFSYELTLGKALL